MRNEQKDLDVSIVCTRNNHDEYTVKIKDRLSINATIEVVLTPEQFAQMVTSMETSGKATVRSPELFGLKREVEDRSIKCPLSSVSAKREELVEWLKQNAKEDGWGVDLYLGSHRSVQHVCGEPGSCILNYRVMRWVKNN